MVDLADVCIAVIVGLLMWGGHHIPWSIIRSAIDENGLLRRPMAYAWGSGWILVAVWAWAARRAAWDVALYVSIVTVAAGIGTMIPRLLKVLVELPRLQEDREELLRRVDRKEKE